MEMLLLKCRCREDGNGGRLWVEVSEIGKFVGFSGPCFEDMYRVLTNRQTFLSDIFSTLTSADDGVCLFFEAVRALRGGAQELLPSSEYLRTWTSETSPYLRGLRQSRQTFRQKLNPMFVLSLLFDVWALSIHRWLGASKQ